MQKSMFWKIDRAFCLRPKVQELSLQLSIPIYASGALLALLYSWGVSNADDNGNINDFTEKAIESACLWNGERGALLSAFHAVGILSGDLEGRSDENPLRIARWEVVADELLRKRQQMRERQQRCRERRDVAGNVTHSVTRDSNCDSNCDSSSDVTLLKSKEYKIEDNTADRSTHTTRFSPPSTDAVAQYMRERASDAGVCCNADSEAERFVDFYQCKGWCVGKTRMKDWRAACRNWLRSSALAVQKQAQVQVRPLVDDVGDLRNLYR